MLIQTLKALIFFMQLDGEMALPHLNITVIDLIFDVIVRKRTTNESELYMQEKLGK